MEKPLFTVIIPTKDRAEFLFHTLRTCSLQDYQNLEIIVSDDGSTDNTYEIVKEASEKDSRIRYVSPGSPGFGVGMLDNFEYALNQVKPGFVIALGGDDGLLPYGISNMWKILCETGQEILAWPAPVYCYPNARHETSQLILNTKKGRPRSGVEILSSKNFLDRQAQNLSYASDIESPMFYVKGVTSTQLIEKIKKKSPNGRFYACATPDGYSGIALAGEVLSYAYSGEPYSIYGLSPTSQGLGYLGGDEKAKKISEAFFSDASRKPMHSELASQPYSPLITLMTADYLLTSKDLNGWEKSSVNINYKILLTKSLEELRHGLYAENRVTRELAILYKYEVCLRKAGSGADKSWDAKSILPHQFS